MSFFANFTQNVTVSEGNSSNNNLDAAGTFTGTSNSTLGVVGIQVSLKTDQDCLVYIDQSPDETNWDIVDSYDYYALTGNFGITVQAVNSYFRVRVKNLSSTSATTYFRLQSVLCPIVEAVPRSLDSGGFLKTSVNRMLDCLGFCAKNTPMGEMRVVDPVRLVGATFVVNTGTSVDSNFWTATTANSGTVVVSGTEAILTATTASGSSSILSSVRPARYVAGSANRFRTQLQLGDTGELGNVRKWGISNGTNGIYFKLSGTSLYVTTLKNGVEDDYISTGWAKEARFPILTNCNTYEIYINNKTVYFVINDILMHSITYNTTTWTNILSVPIRIENTNTGSISQHTINCRSATVFRLGNLITQPQSYYYSGAAGTTVNLKLSGGNLHSMIFSRISNNGTITLADSVSAATPVIFGHTATSNSTVITSADFKGIPFYTGLRLIVSANNTTLNVIYE